MELVVFLTIAAAVVAWAVGECVRSRTWWAAGAVLALTHSVAAFAVFYGGSHAIAKAETTRQTAALTGIEFSGGIYVNYLFLLVWCIDAAWWASSPRSYDARPAWLDASVRGFIFFIMINGAVIFADGWARVLGSAAVAAVVLATARRVRGRP